MYSKVKRFMGIILALSIACALAIPAFAATPRASDYFAETEVWATRTGSGKFIVEFDIAASHTMRELGAKEITIWERQANGSYEEVETFTRYNTSGLMDTNCAVAYGKITYNGTAGTKYYATVALYAKDASGNETLYCDTNVITA